MNKATFAAGCFWGVEAAFCGLPGVIQTSVGYIGGTLENPSYEDVCRGITGHAEAVEMTFDPSIITYEELLNVFWENHDPTTVDRQGPDVGSQYRSEIFFHTEQQRLSAEASRARLDAEKHFGRPIVTEVAPATIFFFAEDYHQQYFAKRGRRSSNDTSSANSATG